MFFLEKLTDIVTTQLENINVVLQILLPPITAADIVAFYVARILLGLTCALVRPYAHFGNFI